MKILNPYDKVDSVYYTLIDILRYVAFIGLVSISMVLSITFYVSAVESLSDKIMLGFAAFALESVKVYTLIYAEYVWHSFKLRPKKKITKWDFFKVSRPYILFFLLTLLSVVASISFAQASIFTAIEEVQVEIKREEALEEKGNPLIIAKTKLLENKQEQLETLNARIALLPPDYVTSSLKLSAEVNTLNEDIYNISEEIATLEMAENTRREVVQEETSAEKETFNRFYLLGKPLGLSETDTLFIFLSLFAILLELGIIATAPAPEKRSIKELIEDRLVKPQVKVAKSISKPKRIKKAQVKVEAKPTPVETINTTIDIPVAKIESEAIEPIPVSVKTPVRKRKASAEILLEELYEKGSTHLKTPAQASYINNRPVEVYLDFLKKIEKVKINGGAPLVSLDGSNHKLNYAIDLTRSILAKAK